MYELEGTDFVAMTESEYLEHFGVPGMKWGHRKSRAKAAEHKADKKAYRYAKKAKKISDALYSKDKISEKQARQVDANLYNARRKLHGKSQLSQEEAADKQNNRDIAIQNAVKIGYIGASLASVYLRTHPDAIQKGAQFTSRMGYNAANSVMNTGVAKAYARRKKYGKYINTTLAGIGN